MLASSTVDYTTIEVDYKGLIMKTWKSYKNYTGIDVSIEVSLFEYGLIWKKNKYCGQDEYYFIYDTYLKDKHGNKLFGSSYLSKHDLISMFDNWASKTDIESFTGQSFDVWIESFPSCIHSMIQYYGTDNVLGTDCNPQPIKE